MHTFFLVLLIGNRYTNHLYSLEPYCNKQLTCIKQKLLSSPWSPFLKSSLNCACDPMCMWTLHVVDNPYPPVYVGSGKFRTDILAHLRFKRILSCWFCNRCMRLKTRIYGMVPSTLHRLGVMHGFLSQTLQKEEGRRVIRKNQETQGPPWWWRCKERNWWTTVFGEHCAVVMWDSLLTAMHTHICLCIHTYMYTM